MTLPSVALKRNFPKLPSDLELVWVNISKENLELALFRTHDNDREQKIASVKKLLKKFKDGTICRELNCRENWWAARLVLLELNGNKAIKEAIV